MAKKEFKSESKRLLDLMINSIYTHKEIFLRELISNASDAIDKLCFIALTDDKLNMSRDDFKIFIKPDKENRTLTITDNGIGMDKDDLENNLGTIASSGSYKFKQEMSEKQDDIDIIGQFGVGFYSAFMVAKKITVVTQLTSGNLTAQTVTKSPKQRGTKSVQQLYLKLRTIQRKKTMMSSLSSTESRDLSRSIPTISAIRL